MLQSVYFEVKNVQDKHDLKQMKKGLDTLYGVLSVSVNQKEHRAVSYTHLISTSLQNPVRQQLLSVQQVQVNPRW